MKIEIDFNEDQLIDAVMANYPEHSSSSLRCRGWDYDKCQFDFDDLEVPTVEKAKQLGSLIEPMQARGATWYFVTRDHLRAGLARLLYAMKEGKLNGLHINLGNFTDPGNWDADCSDALVQAAVFGEVRYG